MEHLWTTNSGMVEDPPYFNDRFNNWNEFILSEIWNRNHIYGCIPVYWIWIDSEDEEYENFDQDELTLVYLSLAPCDARVIKINVNKDDENEIRIWLQHHGFLNLGG